MAEDLVGTPGKALLEVRLPSGRRITLRGTDVRAAGDDEDMGQVEDVMAGPDFRLVTSTLQEVGTLLKEGLIPLRPTEAEVEIGVGLSAKTGRVLVLFGEAAAEASVKVTLKWTFDDEDRAIGSQGDGNRGTEA